MCHCYWENLVAEKGKEIDEQCGANKCSRTRHHRSSSSIHRACWSGRLRELRTLHPHPSSKQKPHNEDHEEEHCSALANVCHFSQI